MDGREAMALSGSHSYYIHRGGVSGSGTQTGGGGGFLAPPGFRSLLNPGIPGQSSGHGNTIGSIFSVEPSQANFVRSNNNIGASSEVPSSEPPVKKKRGRPRKYAPDGGAVSLGLSPMSGTPSTGSLTPSQKRGRGRPPGSGRKQQLASLGGWMNSSAGLAFAPHVLTIGVGEDVASKILSFAQHKPRALCILSASGTVSAVTLRQPASSSGTATYEGRFQILCLAGSYLVAEDGGPQKRTGGLNVSLSSPEGHVFGGAIGGILIAASPVQVVACSFVYGGTKEKEKPEASPKVEGSRLLQVESPTPVVAQNRNLTPTSAVGMWSSSRPIDVRNPHTGFDLTRG